MQIFPGAFYKGAPFEAPPGVEEFKTTTEPADSGGRVAILFHGNGGDISSFLSYQVWLAELGITSYSFDYRGYGKSSGWPSEKGFLTDGRGVISYVTRAEKISKGDLVFIGISLGTAPAARLAVEYEVAALVLFSPFISLKAVASEGMFFWAVPFLFYAFDVATAVSELQDTCLLIAHGNLDHIIPYAHAETVLRSYQGQAYSELITAARAGHNNILHHTRDALGAALKRCLLN